MPGDFARSVQILISLSGNVENQLNNINAQLDKLAGRNINIKNDGINQLTNSAKNASNSINGISDVTKMTEKNVSSNFGSMKDAIDNMQSGVSNLTSSLIGLAAGASLVGLSWKQSADATLYTEQIEKAITNNKSLGISFKEISTFAKEQAAAGEGTTRSNIKELYSILNVGAKYIKGNSQEKLRKADAIADFWFSQQEMMKDNGINSPEQLLLQAVRTEGKMSSRMRDRMALALGVDPKGKEMSSAKSRVKYMIEQGSPNNINMQEELAKRPWEQFSTSLRGLKNSIGDSLIQPMSMFIKILTTVVDIIKSIPLASNFIGISAIVMTLISVLSLLNNVMGPGIVLLKEIIALTNLDTIAKTKNLLVSKTLIVTDWLGVTSLSARTAATTATTMATAAAAATTATMTGAVGMEAVALEVDAVAALGAAGATTTLAAAEWAALTPLLLIALPLIAVAGLLYLVETRTHVFSDALKQLSETEMSQDIIKWFQNIIKWFQDVGYWIGFAVDKLGGAIGNNLTSGINNINSAYKLLKSGAGGIGQLFSMGSGTTESSNVLLLTQKLFNPIFLMNVRMETLVSIINWIKNFFANSSNTISRIYNSIIKLPENFGKWVLKEIEKLIESLKTYFTETITSLRNIIDTLVTKFTTFVTDIKTSLVNLIPSWMKKDDDDSSSTSGGGSGSSAASGGSSRSSGSSGSSSVDSVFHNDIKNVQKKLDDGEYVSGLSTDMGNPSGLAKSAYNAIDSASGGRVSGAVDSAKKSIAALSEGGFINKSGLVMLHSNESVIPADVGNSSRLQNVLENIAYGSGSSTTNQGDINVNINYTSPSGSSSNMIIMDKLSFERMVSDIVAKKLRQLNGY